MGLVMGTMTTVGEADASARGGCEYSEKETKAKERGRPG